MKLVPVTRKSKINKRTKEIKECQENLTTTPYRKIVTSLPFFQLTTNLKQSGSRIPDAYSVKFIFLLIVTFYLTETENRTKKSLTQLLQHCFEKRCYFGQKTLIFSKKC